MKLFFMSIALIASSGSFAQTVLEFDKTIEVSCFSEAKALGCVTPEGEENVTCIEAKKEKLTKQCQDMHQTKKNNK